MIFSLQLKAIVTDFRLLGQRTYSKNPSQKEMAPEWKTSLVVPKAIRAVIEEARISIDYHGVLDVAEAGDRESQGIHSVNQRALETFLNQFADQGFKIGICSYIGETGPRSAERRSQILASVMAFNSDKPLAERIGLRIVTKPPFKAPFLHPIGGRHLQTRSGRVISFVKMEDMGVGFFDFPKCFYSNGGCCETVRDTF